MSTDQQSYYTNSGAASHPAPNNYYLPPNNGMDPRKSILFSSLTHSKTDLFLEYSMQPRPQGPYAAGPMNAPVMVIVLLISIE